MSTETYKIQNSQLESPGGGGDVTTADISYYADGTDGDDGYDGLTANTPKKTLQAVFDLIPYHVQNLVDINLVGIFADDYGVLDKVIEDGYYIAIDGGDAVTSVTGPYTSNAVDATYIETATSVTDRIYTAYWVKITSGTNNGYIRNIRFNFGDIFYFLKKDMDDLQIGDTFDIVKPTTKLTSASSIKLSCSGPGSVVAQRIHFDDGTKIWSEAADATLILTHLTADDSASGPAYSFENCRKVEFSSSLYSNGSFSNAINSAGVGAVGEPINIMTVLTNVNDVSMFSAHLPIVEFNSCGIGLISGGSVFQRRITITNSKSIGGNISEPHSFENTSGYTFTILNVYYDASAPVGVQVINSSMGIKYLMVNSSSTHAVELVNSLLMIITEGSLVGSANTGAGVYAHSGSTMLIEVDNSTLTLTGSVGNFSTDGTTQKSTWAAIQGGTPAVDTDEMTIAEEY